MVFHEIGNGPQESRMLSLVGLIHCRGDSEGRAIRSSSKAAAFRPQSLGAVEKEVGTGGLAAAKATSSKPKSEI